MADTAKSMNPESKMPCIKDYLKCVFKGLLTDKCLLNIYQSRGLSMLFANKSCHSVNILCLYVLDF